ncbi:MAG TPA: stage III sporulation protein AB [Candidatus Gemmiger faecigallinarum]|nr:stage III sporulation protein AB [Candidatus Gemmiger faecigallinarum]
MTAAVYLAGICLLAGCGAGAGWLLARRSREQWRQAHAFGRLLEYLQAAVRYRTLTGGEVLDKAAAYPEFARLGLEHCPRFGMLRPPDAFDPALRQELSADLEALEGAPRDSACAMLARMLALCRRQETELRKAADAAARLYPRLGGCIGAMAAILLL